MLPTHADIAVAEQLLHRLRELVTPAAPELCRAGELPEHPPLRPDLRLAVHEAPGFPGPVVLGAAAAALESRGGYRLA